MKHCFPFIVLTLSVWGCGCRTTRPLENAHPVAVHPVEWGGGPARNFTVNNGPQPPLALKWEKRTEAAFSRGLSSDGRVVVAGLQNGTLELYRLSDGKRLVRQRIMRQSDATALPAGNRFVVALHHKTESLQSLDGETLKPLWKAEAGDVAGEPLVLGDTIFVASTQGRMRSFDLNQGVMIAERQLETHCLSGPAADARWVYIAGGDGRVCALDRHTLAIQWVTRLSGRTAASPALRGGRLFIGTLDDRCHALDCETGAVIWSKPTGGGVFETVAVDEETVYIPTARGTLWALAVDDGSIRWQFDAGCVIGTSPLLVGDALYFGGVDSLLRAVRRSDGAPLWEISLKGRIRNTPIVVGPWLIVASEGRMLYGFQSTQH